MADLTAMSELVETRTGVAVPMDPHSLPAEVERLNDYIGTLTDTVDRLHLKVALVTRPSGDPVPGGAFLKDPSQPAELTTRVTSLADRLSEQSDRLQRLIDRIDL